MNKLNSTYSEYSEDVESITDWCNSKYNDLFAKYFKDQRNLAKRLSSDKRSITDSELEFILTDVPLNLFDVSEILATIESEYQAIKLMISKKESDITKKLDYSTETAKRREAEIQCIEDHILLIAYDRLINQVNRELSYSRELIMSAKKLWDSRRRTDTINPVSEKSYSEDLQKVYIK